MTDNKKPDTDAEEISPAERFAGVRRKAAAMLDRHQRLIRNLNSDLEKHGDPDIWKRYGDLLLSQLKTARRIDDRIFVTDYFDEAVPEIAIVADRQLDINQVAEKYFKRYTKARNGRKMIAERLEKAEAQAASAAKQLARIDEGIASEDVEFLESLLEKKPVTRPLSKKKKADAAFKGVRRFNSSDGFEILVGKRAADNDHLTFRIAKSLDTWLHAADYPGSHVVIRSSGKKEIPQRTLTEAAQLAAFYSDAREMPKAAVNHTLRKFVNKPKRSAPGLVSLSSFRTILVEPKIGELQLIV